jgi:hypothetical protein
MTVGRIPVIEGGIQPTIFDAKADLLTATANDTPARLAVGSNGNVLTADSSEATGLKWSGAWATWTPTYNGITVGNGTVTARYAQVGKTVNLYYTLTFGSTTSFSGSLLLISIPIAASASYTQYVSILGLAKYTDTATQEYTGFIDYYNNVYGVRLMSSNSNGTYLTATSTSPTVPFTFGTGDTLSFTISYEGQ